MISQKIIETVYKAFKAKHLLAEIDILWLSEIQHYYSNTIIVSSARSGDNTALLCIDKVNKRLKLHPIIFPTDWSDPVVIAANSVNLVSNDQTFLLGDGFFAFSFLISSGDSNMNASIQYTRGGDIDPSIAKLWKAFKDVRQKFYIESDKETQHKMAQINFEMD